MGVDPTEIEAQYFLRGSSLLHGHPRHILSLLLCKQLLLKLIIGKILLNLFHHSVEKFRSVLDCLLLLKKLVANHLHSLLILLVEELESFD